jgi:hypothetical protein
MTRSDLGVTAAGVNVSFRVGCQVPATSGAVTARLLLALARCPMQYGHRVPRRARPAMVVCHSCPAGHCHHTRRFDPARRSFGSSGSLRLGCHCASNHATSRNHSASDAEPGRVMSTLPAHRVVGREQSWLNRILGGRAPLIDPGQKRLSSVELVAISTMGTGRNARPRVAAPSGQILVLCT